MVEETVVSVLAAGLVDIPAMVAFKLAILLPPGQQGLAAVAAQVEILTPVLAVVALTGLAAAAALEF